MNAIKIMHIFHSLEVGGLQNGVVNLINTMDRSRFVHSICCIDQSGIQAEKLSRGNIEIHEMKKGDGRELLLFVRLARLLKKAKPDIVHTRNWGAIDGIIGAIVAGVPAVVHGEHGRDMTDPYGRSMKRRLIRKGLSHFVDRYITVSQDLREWLISVVGIDERKVQTICNGVDNARFNPDDKELVRAKYDYRNNKFVIGTVGRLDPVKDQQLLIKALAQLNNKYPRLTLLIIGDGPCRKDLENQAMDLGLKKEVRFLGMRHDVPELLKLLDVFVLPSYIEGISNTILEAMATGLPVIATRVGGSPELVVDGETGYLVPKQELGALATVLERYILNRAIVKQHGAAARQRAIQGFGLDQMVAHYEALYTNFVTRKFNKVIAC